MWIIVHFTKLAYVPPKKVSEMSVVLLLERYMFAYSKQRRLFSSTKQL